MKQVSSVNPYLLAIRPKTLPASISPVILATALAWRGGVNIWLFLSISLFALLIQIGTNLANDYFDYLQGADFHRRQGPIRVTAAGLLPKEKVRQAFILVFSGALLISIYPIFTKGGALFLGLALLSIFCGIFYTATRYSIAYLGLGELFVFLFFGPIYICSSYFLYSGTVTLSALLLSISSGLLSMNILLVNNIRDVEEDRFANKKTLIVRCGRKIGIYLYLISYIVAYLITLLAILMGIISGWALFICITIPYAVNNMTLLRDAKEGADYNTLLARTAKLFLLYSLTLAIGLLI